MAACHISLAQPHILDQIFASFSEIPLLLSANTPESGQLRTNNSTLVNAALTCRAFAEPASAVLWSAMHAGLIPLLFSLSNFKLDTSKENHEKYPTYQLTYPSLPTPKNIIEGGVSPSEWARFEVLARRIRYLSYSDPVDAKGAIDPSVVHLLVGQCGERPLLPNLRVLKWTPLGPKLEQQLLLESLFRTRTITKLILARWPRFESHAWDGRPLDVSDMAIVARVCPGLRDLVIDPHAVNLANAIPRTFYNSFHGLRSARVLLTQPTHHRELAMLPHLESLVLDNRLFVGVDNGTDMDDETGSASAITPAFRGFPALRTLEVLGYSNVSSASRILPTITSPMLSVVIMRIDLGFGGHERFIHLIETMCALPAAQQLRTFHLGGPPGRMLSSAQQAGWRWELPFRESAGALLQLHNLQDVSLGPTWRTWSITDDDVRAMQQAWPHIRSLEWRSFLMSTMSIKRRQPSGVFVDLPALSTLVTFAQNSCDLEVLKMECREIREDELAELDARAAAMELEEESTHGTGPKPRLQKLIVHARGGIFHQSCPEMSGGDVGRLNRTLRRLFPRLVEIQIK
ncbi:hypothetical protein C8Q74DRAFT_1218715 [Fomes fomentarius]|nr:hypothetical protein C8Q74DRAFT_1218715 [Fomes fomentarius]